MYTPSFGKYLILMCLVYRLQILHNLNHISTIIFTDKIIGNLKILNSKKSATIFIEIGQNLF